MSETIVKDGIHAMIDREDMDRFAIKWRDAYAMVPDAPLVQKTFGLWMCIDKWYTDGLPEDSDLNQLFMLEPSGQHLLKEIGWCEAAFQPQFESVIIEDRGDTEVVQDLPDVMCSILKIAGMVSCRNISTIRLKTGKHGKTMLSGV